MTVAAAERTEKTETAPAVVRPQTVSSGNTRHDWAKSQRSVIEGLAEGIQLNAE